MQTQDFSGTKSFNPPDRQCNQQKSNATLTPQSARGRTNYHVDESSVKKKSKKLIQAN
jgi:hypothetical protein